MHLSLYAAGMPIYNIAAITGDRATLASDPSTAMVPYGMGGTLVVPPVYKYAVGFNALNAGVWGRVPEWPRRYRIVVIESIQQALAKYWGYNDFLPLQKEAMECAGRGRDSIVVLPTGGGKSLCFQAPAVIRGGLTVVVSPLISLMNASWFFLRSSSAMPA